MLFHLKDAVEFGEHYYPYVPDVCLCG